MSTKFRSTNLNHTRQPRNAKGHFVAEHVRQRIDFGDRFVTYIQLSIDANKVTDAIADRLNLWASDRIGLRIERETSTSGTEYNAVYLTGATGLEADLVGLNIRQAIAIEIHRDHAEQLHQKLNRR